MRDNSYSQGYREELRSIHDSMADCGPDDDETPEPPRVIRTLTHDDLIAGMRGLLEDHEKLTAAVIRYGKALKQIRDCDWVITLPDRMDAVREIARNALQE